MKRGLRVICGRQNRKAGLKLGLHSRVWSGFQGFGSLRYVPCSNPFHYVFLWRVLRSLGLRPKTLSRYWIILRKKPHVMSHGYERFINDTTILLGLTVGRSHRIRPNCTAFHHTDTRNTRRIDLVRTISTSPSVNTPTKPVRLEEWSVPRVPSLSIFGLLGTSSLTYARREGAVSEHQSHPFASYRCDGRLQRIPNADREAGNA